MKAVNAGPPQASQHHVQVVLGTKMELYHAVCLGQNSTDFGQGRWGTYT